MASRQRWSSDDQQATWQRHGRSEPLRLGGGDALGARGMSYDQAGGLDRRISSHASYQSEVCILCLLSSDFCCVHARQPQQLAMLTHVINAPSRLRQGVGDLASTKWLPC